MPVRLLGVIPALAALVVLVAIAREVPMATPAVAAPGEQSADAGRTAFEARCANCHGSDGAGSGQGPSIVDLRQPRAGTTAAIRDLIRTGLPASGMPAFALPDAEVDLIASFVDTLRSPAAERPVAGDVALGEAYFGRHCSSCHMVRGVGGAVGPDLSNLGRVRRLAQIERALREPGSLPPPASGGRGAGAASFRGVTVEMRDGRTVRGLLKYEDLSDLGVLDLEGRFHSIARSRTRAVRAEASLMPAVSASPAELQNLLAYLTRLSASSAGASPLAPTAAPPAPALSGGLPFADIARPAPGEWPTYHGHLSGNRHSPLAEITSSNVAGLAPKWMVPLSSTSRALQVTPVVAGGLMFVSAVNEAWAFDARTGRQVWHFSQPRTQGLVGDPASGINRGVAVLGDRVFLQTDHAHLLALHRLTGQLLWDVEMADYRQHYGSTGAPLVVNDLVIAGVSGGDEGVRGFLDAYRASTGERVWRFWTVPAPGEPGSETWKGRAWEHGCAATWLTGTYDPEARILYWPTGNPCPDYNGDERQGDNLYSNSVIALDPDTGRLKWHFQFTPHDLHDWDAAQTPALVDATFRGQPRKLLLHGDRNGFFYVLDRLTGEFLLGEPFVRNITWASGIGRAGRPIYRPGFQPTPEGTRVCPAVTGATNWPATAFSPRTGLYYLMAEEACSIFTRNANWWVQGQSFYGGATRRSPTDTSAKFLRAIDIQTGRIAWEIPNLSGGVIASGVMSTEGGLVFFGDAAGGAFIAADAATGAILWRFNTGLAWKAAPMSYAIDGRQYVAVVAGSTLLAFGLP
jgi:PQQ-dependent dehydrogenase (methanol/ethanol family)